MIVIVNYEYTKSGEDSSKWYEFSKGWKDR